MAGFFNLVAVVTITMSKPRIVEVKKPPKKPTVVNIEDDYSRILTPVDPTTQKLREQQLNDAIPQQPPISPLGVDSEVRRKIEEDRKKRRGLAGEVKDVLGLK